MWAPIVAVSLAASWRRSSGSSVPASGGGAEPTCHRSETASSARWIPSPKRKQVAADRIEVCPDPGRTEWEADVRCRLAIDLPHVRWPRAQQCSEAVPPETVVVPRMPLVTKTVIGTPLDWAIGCAVVSLSR